MKPIKLNFMKANKTFVCHLVKLENDNEFLVQYNVNNTDFLMSFFIESDIAINKRHIENIDELKTVEKIEDAHTYFDLIEKDLIEICKKRF